MATRSLDNENMIMRHVVPERYHIEVSEPKYLLLKNTLMLRKSDVESWRDPDLINLICIVCCNCAVNVQA